MLEIKVNTENCKGCKLCIETCPREVLKLSNITNSQSYFYSEIENQENCIGCKQCAEICPDACIEIYKN